MDTLSIAKTAALPALAAALAYLVFQGLTWLLSLSSGTRRALGDFAATGSRPGADPERAAMGSRPYRIRLAFSSFGLNVSDWEEVAFYGVLILGSLLLAGAILTLGLPVVLVPAAAFVAWIALNAWVQGAWDKERLDLEKEIPTLLARLGSLLKANPNLIESLEGVAEGLDPEKPLKPWIRRLAKALHAGGRHGLEEMQAEAQQISASLLLTVVEIGRLWETGGQGYAEALRLAADNLSDLLETRAQAGAVANGAWGTARTILLALGFTLGSVLVNPISRPAFSTPFIQFGLLAAIAWAGLGFWQIRDLIAAVAD